MYAVGNLFGNEVMTYESEGRLFVWHGGPYIDIVIETNKEECNAFQWNGKMYFYSDLCINVWDYGKGKAHIEFGDSQSFITECEEWMSL
jgi:hypothetical protein